MKISFIGAGNVATHLSKALQQVGHEIIGVYSRTQSSSKEFAQRYNKCHIARTLEDLPDSDIYIFSIKDDALPIVISDFSKLQRPGICIHTAGSIPMEIFKSKVLHYGVMYPLQTFTKKRDLDLTSVPLFIEGNSDEIFSVIFKLANQISCEVYPLSSALRKQLHLAAVFACNFSNHCYAIAGEILNKVNLPERLLLPLVTETFSKLSEMSAIEGQTGPAVRYDKKVMDTQIQLLGNDEIRKDIYRKMSESIHDYAMNKLKKKK